MALSRQRAGESSPRLGLGVFLTYLMAIGTFPVFALGTLAPFIIDDLDLSRTQLGSVSTVLLCVAAVTAPIVGTVSDRISLGRLCVVLLVVGTLALAGVAAAPSIGWMLIGGALFGITCGGVLPLTNRILAERVRPGLRGRIMGSKSSGVQAAGLAAGLFLPSLGLAIGWRSSLIISAVVVAIGIPFSRLASGPAAPADSQPHPPALRNGRDFVGMLTVYAVLMGFAVSAVMTFLVLYGVEDLDLSERAAGLGAACLGVAGIAARIVWTDLSERTVSALATLACLPIGGAAAVGLVWAADATGLWLFWLGAGLFGATAVAWNAVGNLVIISSVGGAAAGRSSGIMQAGFYVGYASAPVLIGSVVDWRHSYGAGWAIVVGTMATASIWILAWTLVSWGRPHSCPV